MRQTVIVVPCHNEATRLDGPAFRPLLDRPELSLLFVDDGSTDETPRVLERMCTDFGARGAVIHLERNCGKGEAVRQGLRHALAGGADTVGYLDADLATPPAELLRLLDHLESGAYQVAMASRVLLLGRDVVRRASRHYLGRVFASLASLCLGVGVYDTQCGAKVFRRSETLVAALADPFVSRWAFDVELLGRLLVGGRAVPGLPVSAFIEMPVRHWHDVAGSKLRLLDIPRMGVDLARIRIHLARRRRQAAIR